MYVSVLTHIYHLFFHRLFFSKEYGSTADNIGLLKNLLRSRQNTYFMKKHYLGGYKND